MRCESCKKKGIVCVPCRHCEMKTLCPSCVMMEQHACAGAETKVQAMRKEIEDRNPRVIADKLDVRA